MSSMPEIEYRVIPLPAVDLAKPLNEHAQLDWTPVAYAVDGGYHSVILARRRAAVAARLEWYRAALEAGVFDEVPEMKEEAQEFLRRFGPA